MGIFDLDKHFGFYGAYHSNPINILIHMIFVWPIFFTNLIILYFTPPLISINHPAINNSVVVFNYGFFLTCIYAIFYVGLDKKAGTLTALICFLCWVSSSHLANHLGFSLAWKVVLVAQICCWIGQLVGHGVFEKRAPAFTDNFSLAFLMAPYFCVLEALQSLFGYEPYPGFHKSVQGKIEAEIENWKERTQKKVS